MFSNIYKVTSKIAESVFQNCSVWLRMGSKMAILGFDNIKLGYKNVKPVVDTGSPVKKAVNPQENRLSNGHR